MKAFKDLPLRERKASRTRLAIFEAGRELLRDKGLGEIKIEEICDRAEISRGTFFSYFSRKKDLIITAGGKNIAPSRIEGIMVTSKYINQFCVVGDRRKYLSAVATLDEENVTAHAKEKGIPYGSYEELLAHSDIKALIDREIAERNSELASFETIKKVALVPEFTIENNMMTPTFKLKKNVIIDNYEEKIETLYT